MSEVRLVAMRWDGPDLVPAADADYWENGVTQEEVETGLNHPDNYRPTDWTAFDRFAAKVSAAFEAQEHPTSNENEPGEADTSRAQTTKE